MKYKLKTRLFAALALSGVSFYWPASRVVAQEDDFRFIRPAEPTGQDDQESSVPPIAQPTPIVQRPSVSGLLQPSNTARPPAAIPQALQSPQAVRSRVASAPVPFASSNVFNGAYIAESNAGEAQHQLPSQGLQQSTVQQVSHQEPIQMTELPPILPGAHAERDLPPVVQASSSLVPQIVQPIEQNELPPILTTTEARSDLQPIVSPNAGLSRLLSRIQTSDQNESLIPADGSSVDETSSVKPAGFGATPLIVQEAPPIINSIVQDSVAGELPSLDGSLVPIDPTVPVPTVPVPSEGAFPRATADSTVPQSVFEQALPQQPSTTSQTFFEPVAQQAPVFGGCSTCGSSGGSCGCSGGHGSGVSACSSCGENGCFDPAQVESLFNSSGANAYARRYAIAEALYFDRTEGQITNSNFGSLNNFDPAGGARITVGRRDDSTRGREFQYSGIESAAQTLQVFSDTGEADSQFVPFGGLVGDNVLSFFNATEQSQSAETYFHSLEFNRVKWGWDVIKSYIGFRYIYVDDEYTLFSQSLGLAAGSIVPAESGFFQVAATNHLIGPHLGGELFYDVGYRWSLSGVSRLGAYLNINTFDTHLVNDGVEFIDAEDTNTTISFTYEIGVNAKFRLTRQSHFRVGYNILFFDNLATASDNLLNIPAAGGIPISPTLGSTTTDEESVLFHGLSLGFEVYR